MSPCGTTTNNEQGKIELLSDGSWKAEFRNSVWLWSEFDSESHHVIKSGYTPFFPNFYSASPFRKIRSLNTKEAWYPSHILQTGHDRPSGYHWICVILVVPLRSATIPNAYTAQTKTPSQSPIDLGCRDWQFGLFPKVFLSSSQIWDPFVPINLSSYTPISHEFLVGVFCTGCEFCYLYFTKWKIYIIGDYRLRYQRLIDLTVRSPPPDAIMPPRPHGVTASPRPCKLGSPDRAHGQELELVTLLMDTWKSERWLFGNTHCPACFINDRLDLP